MSKRQDLTTPAADPALRDPELAVEIVIGLACRIFAMRPQDFMASRSQAAMKARSAAIDVARQLTGLSWPALGRLFYRDHTTLLNSQERLTVFRNGSASFCRQHDRLLLEARYRIAADLGAIGAGLATDGTVMLFDLLEQAVARDPARILALLDGFLASHRQPCLPQQNRHSGSGIAAGAGRAWPDGGPAEIPPSIHS